MTNERKAGPKSQNLIHERVRNPFIVNVEHLLHDLHIIHKEPMNFNSTTLLTVASKPCPDHVAWKES
ncbi:hypothetical protein T01_13339 [Trichinella spiralis]|uniref:Uncharacterized protein n=1 Tax=Trichinella spiralis TaxID=6334 RepID=A0A0V1AUJ0_TRISP|nr:hypothetical protein T01_13339 [Trichinella spiralis]